jgi:hypothetical protein
VEREAKLTVRQEEEKTADVDMERVEVKAVPVAEFGDYVVDGHSNSNEVFTIYYNVRVMHSQQWALRVLHEWFVFRAWIAEMSIQRR